MASIVARLRPGQPSYYYNITCG